MVEQSPQMAYTAPTRRQECTRLAADVALGWWTALVVAGIAHGLFGASTDTAFGWFFASMVLFLLGNGIVLVGATGRSIGARVAGTAEVSSTTGQPLGVATYAHIVTLGQGDADPRYRHISTL